MKLKTTFTFSERAENELKREYESKEEIEKEFAYLLAKSFKLPECLFAFKWIETEVEE